MRYAAIALVVLMLLSGCTKQTETPIEPENGEPIISVDENRPEPTAGDVTTGPAAQPDLNATLDAPPRLIEGEWWRIKFRDDFADFEADFIRVVADVHDEGYVFGMPHAGWFKEAVIFHTPAFGDVNLDLSHHAHDVPFKPLVFPLDDGAQWETHWEFADVPLTATVTRESDLRANVRFIANSCPLQIVTGLCVEQATSEAEIMNLTYDATMHEVVKLSSGGLTWEVVEHGYGFEGWVTVPRAEDLVFLHGRAGNAAVQFPYAAPTQITDTIEVDGGFNRVSFILGAGNVLQHPGGAYSIKAIAPNGTEYVKESIPGAAFDFDFFEHGDPDGTWTIEYVIAGPGYAFIEGIAYHQYDILVPKGDIRTDHSHPVVR